MIAEIFFSKIDSIGPGSETTLIDFKPSPISSQTVEVSKMSELTVAITAYANEARNTGLCGRVYVRKVGRDRSIAGFNNMDTRGVLVNRHVGEAAADDM